MAFIRVVEVLPPHFRRSKSELSGAGSRMAEFSSQISRFKEYADIFMVANMKDQALLKFDAVHVATSLERQRGVAAAPVLVVRDQNRPQFLSSVLTAFSAGLKAIMLAWGDEYPDGGASNVRDFQNLAEAIAESAKIRRMMGFRSRILAPVNVDRLSTPKWVSVARARLDAGAELLLAQPPTTDAGDAFERQVAVLDEAGLKKDVLLNVFPFTSPSDVARYERLFGWRLPKGLHRAAREGPAPLLGLQRDIVRRMRKENLPGVYLSTRGDISLAERLLS